MMPSLELTACTRFFFGDSIFSRKNKPFKLLFHGPKWLSKTCFTIPTIPTVMVNSTSGTKLPVTLSFQSSLELGKCRFEWSVESPIISWVVQVGD